MNIQEIPDKGFFKSKYRPEIDGLRAISVIAVIINHFNKDILPSGYLGVDIFFVVSGYVITNSLTSRKCKSFSEFIFETQLVNYMVIVLFILLIFNLSGYLYLGDSGSYLLSLFTGLFLIEFSNANPAISPYFIIVLLWYPCFENLFSIIRKLIANKNPLEPDNGHLHYHLYSVIKKRFKLSKIYSNTFASILINIFNFVIFYVASLNIYHTSYQLSIIIFSIIFYIIIYFILKKLVSN